MADAGEVTSQLERLYRAGQVFAFIAGAHRTLAQLFDAPRLAAITLRALVEQGLGGPARELLQLRPELRGAAGDADFAAALRDVPNGRVPWSECTATYERNRAALLRWRPYLQAVAETLPARLARIHLYRTTNGQHYLARRQPGALREWLANLNIEPADTNLALPPAGRLNSAVVVGLRLGELAARLLADTANKFLQFSPPLYLVEPDLVRFAAWMHAADQTSLLDEQRVHVFVGDDAAAELGRQLDQDSLLLIPEICVHQSGREEDGRAVTEAAQAVAATRAREVVELERALEERYRDRDAAYWAMRFRRPGTILGLTSRFTTMLQYSMRDALDALRRAGWDTEMVIERKDHEQLSSIEVCRRVLEVDPVLVILIDHLRYEASHLPSNLPLLSWIQDPMPNLLCPQAARSLGDFDFICGYYIERCTRDFGYPRERFLPTVIPVSETTFHAAPRAADALAPYACDVSFVSNASEPIDRYYQSALATYPADYQPLLPVLYRRVREMLSRGAELSQWEGAPGLVRSVAKELGMRLDDTQVDSLANHFPYRVYDLGRRQQTLEWVAAWARRTGRTLRIYGRGWEKHPTLAPFAAGVIEHGEPLRLALRASRLALQLIPSGFCHQRSYEVLAAGTLPLTRYCHADFEGLPVGEYMRRLAAGQIGSGSARVFPQLEHIVFRTAAEFEALAERFLSADRYKADVLNGLRDIVLREYTYGALMPRLMDWIAGILRSQAEPRPVQPPVAALTHTL